MEGTYSQAPAVPPRRHCNPGNGPTGNCDQCSVHRGNSVTVICTTCIELLCNKCLSKENHRHSRCSVSSLNGDVDTICKEIKTTLSLKMNSMKESTNVLHQSLAKKRDRMLKKKNETALEIQRYFQRLREKLLTKLQLEETGLLDHLEEKVSEQNAVINKNIDECSSVLHGIQEDKSMIENFDRIYNLSSCNNPNAYLNNLLRVSNDINANRQRRPEIEAARDAFLVIRFFVNSETEQELLNRVIAYVEVLHSSSNNQGSGNLESERINEVSNNNSHVSDSELDIVVADVNGEQLRDLPPLDNIGNSAALENAVERNRTPSPYNTTRNPPAIPPPSPQTIVNSPLLDIETGSEVTGNSNGTRSSIHDYGVVDTPGNNADSRTSQGQDVNSDGTVIRVSGQSNVNTNMDNFPRPDMATGNNHNSMTVRQNLNNDSENINASSNLPAESSSNASGSSSNGQTRNTACTPTELEDLPPPYPGLPMPLAPPGPGELPPPYPGPPPPPYAQHPEPQQPSNRSRSRGRLDAESESGGNRNSRPLSGVLLSPTGTSPTPRSSSPVSNVTRPRGPLKSFSISEVSDKRAPGIVAMAVYNDNSFLIIDRWNKKLKFINDIGESFGGLIFREEPWDITRVTNDLYAVTVPKLSTFYKVKATNERVVTIGTIATQRKYACIAFCSQSELFVCGQVPQFGEPVIDVLGVDGGPILLSFRTDIQGQELFSYPRYVKVSNDGTAIVCDWNLKCLVVFKLDGTVIGRYRGTVDYPLNDPTGIELNLDNGKLFVIDSKRTSTEGVIHKTSLQCKCEAIYQGQNEFRDSRAISAYGEKIAVGNKNGIINLFSIRQRYR